MNGPHLPAYDVVILGAGAAGLMCAITAGARGRRVLVLDHAPEPGRKILISGGGRCNFTNLHTSAGQFFSANPHFCKSALARYTPADFLALVGKHNIAWHEKTLGQLFCDGSARAIVAMLLAECEAAGVSIRLNCEIREVTRDVRFRIATECGDIEAESVVLASGGLSIPKLGATGLAHRLAARFGLGLTAIMPGLVPLIFAPDDATRLQGLAGVALPIEAQCGAHRFREAMLFTHRGLSGPAILQISTAWQEKNQIMLDLLSDQPAAILQQRKRERPRAGLRCILGELLPQRLADALLPPALAQGQMAALTDRALADFTAGLRRWHFSPAGTEGYAKAEVTRA
jgi:predicted Rossmann fold flavoprotein